MSKFFIIKIIVLLSKLKYQISDAYKLWTIFAFIWVTYSKTFQTNPFLSSPTIFL